LALVRSRAATVCGGVHRSTFFLLLTYRIRLWPPGTPFFFLSPFFYDHQAACERVRLPAGNVFNSPAFPLSSLWRREGPKLLSLFAFFCGRFARQSRFEVNPSFSLFFFLFFTNLPPSTFGEAFSFFLFCGEDLRRGDLRFLTPLLSPSLFSSLPIQRRMKERWGGSSSLYSRGNEETGRGLSMFLTIFFFFSSPSGPQPASCLQEGKVDGPPTLLSPPPFFTSSESSPGSLFFSPLPERKAGRNVPSSPLLSSTPKVLFFFRGENRESFQIANSFPPLAAGKPSSLFFHILFLPIGMSLSKAVRAGASSCLLLRAGMMIDDLRQMSFLPPPSPSLPGGKA